MFRLMGLLVALSLGLGGTAALFGDHTGTPNYSSDSERDAPPAVVATPASMSLDGPSEVFARRPLPESVRRLADSPQTGALRPVVFGEAQPVPPPQPQNVALRGSQPALPEGFLRVKAARANVRGGPSTNFEIVGRLTRGEEVEVLEVDPAGWVLIAIQGDGMTGWISQSLLTQ